MRNSREHFRRIEHHRKKQLAKDIQPALLLPGRENRRDSFDFYHQEKIRARAKFQCEVDGCGERNKKKLVFHHSLCFHAVAEKYGLPPEIYNHNVNGQLLCSLHHNKLHDKLIVERPYWMEEPNMIINLLAAYFLYYEVFLSEPKTLPQNLYKYWQKRLQELAETIEPKAS